MNLRLRLGQVTITADVETDTNWRVTAKRGDGEPFMDVRQGAGGLNEDELALAFLGAEEPLADTRRPLVVDELDRRRKANRSVS
jgi:hypothetical protein